MILLIIISHQLLSSKNLGSDEWKRQQPAIETSLSQIKLQISSPYHAQKQSQNTMISSKLFTVTTCMYSTYIVLISSKKPTDLVLYHHTSISYNTEWRIVLVSWNRNVSIDLNVNGKSDIHSLLLFLKFKNQSCKLI